MQSDMTHQSKTQRRTIIGTTAGNALEFFDFTVFGFLAVTIGKLFFPVADSTGQLLLSVATFGVGFVMRPIGGLVIGAFADRAGRKPAMTLTISLMALGCAIIACTPTYAQIGIAAPILIVVARLLQGFSAGGEIGASTTLLMEHGSVKNRGYMSSWQFASQGLGVLMGALMVSGLNLALTEEQMLSWGWRVPFIVGMLIAPVGIVLRRKLSETHEPIEHVAGAKREGSFTLLWRNHKPAIGAGILLAMGVSSAAYVITFYMPTYAVKQLGLTPAVALFSAALTGLLTFVFAPIVGKLSDRFGRRSLIIFSRLILMIVIFPAFSWLVAEPSPARLYSVMVLLGLLVVIQTVPGITVMTELFPKQVRASGMSLVYSFGVTVFGGFAPFINTWLVSVTGDRMAPAWYLIVMTLVSLIGIFMFKDMAGRDLDANEAISDARPAEPNLVAK